MSSTEQANESPDLVDLISRVAQGQLAAFEELHVLTVKRVHGLILRVLVDPALSEDSTQEVYIQVWFTAHKYNPDLGSPMAWLLMIAHRRAVDRVRSEQRSIIRQSKYAIRTGTLDHDPVPDLVDRLATVEAVGRCLESLTALQHESIHLAYYGGLTYADVADKLKVKPSTVKSRIRDGLIRLRSCLENQGFERNPL